MTLTACLLLLGSAGFQTCQRLLECRDGFEDVPSTIYFHSQPPGEVGCLGVVYITKTIIIFLRPLEMATNKWLGIAQLLIRIINGDFGVVQSVLVHTHHGIEGRATFFFSEHVVCELMGIGLRPLVHRGLVHITQG